MKGVYFYDEDEITVLPLDENEKVWIRRLQKTLAACPSRLELVTIGDASVHVVDREGALRSEICDGACERDGISLAHIDGGPLIHGVSG
jgi:hypothetical protein